MRTPALALAALAGLTGMSLAGCGGGSAHHGTAASGAVSAPSGGPADGTDAGPLPSGSPRGEAGAGTCQTVSYRLTAAGVQISAQVATAPVKLNFEADDRDDNPVTGDPGTSGVTYTFTAAHAPRTLLIKGVRSLDHLTVIALGGDATCRAYAD